MPLAPDIIRDIESTYRDASEVVDTCSAVEVPEKERVIRCILHLAQGDIDSLTAYVRRAEKDYRDVIWSAEYDNRNNRKYDFRFPIDNQRPYSENE